METTTRNYEATARLKKARAIALKLIDADTEAPGMPTLLTVLTSDGNMVDRLFDNAALAARQKAPSATTKALVIALVEFYEAGKQGLIR